MKLTTQRLDIVPLTLDQFALLLEGTEKMEAALKLNVSGAEMDSHTEQAMKWLYETAVLKKDAYLWYTNWQIILRKENRAIGSACFKGAPDKEGEVELGYGIYENYQCFGYMTEAAKALLAWAASQPNVQSVIAETEKTNIASQRVLEKCGMCIFKETAECYYWHKASSV